MASINVQLSFDQLLSAVQHLPKSLKIKLYQSLDAELHQAEIEREFRRALGDIWNTYKDIPETEVNRDIEIALEQVRAENAAG
jgi:hypothetical protein